MRTTRHKHYILPMPIATQIEDAGIQSSHPSDVRESECSIFCLQPQVLAHILAVCPYLSLAVVCKTTGGVQVI